MEEIKIVLKGKDEDGKELKKNVYAQRSSGLILPEYRPPRSRMGMQLQLM
jgi:hypothetical protein